MHPYLSPCLLFVTFLKGRDEVSFSPLASEKVFFGLFLFSWVQSESEMVKYGDCDMTSCSRDMENIEYVLLPVMKNTF